MYIYLHALAIFLSLGLTQAPSFAAENENEPYRFLNIPIRGAVGVDANTAGVKDAIALAVSQKYDGITVEIRCVEGDMASALEIAGLIREAGSKIQTIALIKNAGGPVLPILYSCESWAVVNTEGEDALEWPVLQTLPTFSVVPNGIRSQLATLSIECKGMLPAGIDDDTRKKRSALIEIMTKPGSDIIFDDGSIRPIQSSEATEPKDATRINISNYGPGITPNGLAKLGLAPSLTQDLPTLAKFLNVSEVEPQGDSGLVLVGDAADVQFAKRAQLGSLIDSVFSIIDGIDSLSASFPWTLTRARLTEPVALPRLWKYSMVINENDQWVLSDKGSEHWRESILNSVRLWMGVEVTVNELTALFARLDVLQDELMSRTAGRLDRERLDAAKNLLKGIVPSKREYFDTISHLNTEARGHIERLEGMLVDLPMIPVTQ